MKTSVKVNTIVLSLCEAVIGILLLINPAGFTKAIIIFLGAVLFAAGISDIVRYFREKPAVAALGQELTQGCIGIAAGLFCMAKSGWFIATFPILTILYGIGTLFTGFAKVQWTVDRLRLKTGKWCWSALSAALTLALAALILCNPFSSTAVLWIIIAIGLIVEAVLDVIAAVFAREDPAV